MKGLSDLGDDLDHERMQLEWPIWPDLLKSIFKLRKPKKREWTEEEKYLELIMKGGRHIREIASPTAPGENEIEWDEEGVEPKFSNLIKRVDATFQPQDPTTEITVLRKMIRKKEEAIREFLKKVRRQLSLSGYGSAAEKDRDLSMVLKQNTIDAIEISTHSMGLNVNQIELLAINL